MTALTDEEIMNMTPDQFNAQVENGEHNENTTEDGNSGGDDGSSGTSTGEDERGTARPNTELPRGGSNGEAAETYGEGEGEYEEEDSTGGNSGSGGSTNNDTSGTGGSYNQTGGDEAGTVHESQSGVGGTDERGATDNEDNLTEQGDVGQSGESGSNSEWDLSSVSSVLESGLPFNGGTIDIANVEELIDLAQKGLGSNKRMQALKPQMQLMATLTQHGLDSAEDISLLIEASKGKPEAIKALMDNNKLDYLDFGDVQGENYSPTDQTIDKKTYELKQVNDEISALPKYAEAIAEVNTYEDADLDIIREQPAYLGMIRDHHENGYYEQVKQIISTEQAKGKFLDKSFLQAYSAVLEVIGENLAGSSGKGEAGHNNGSTRRSSNSTSGTSPHDNQQNANSGRKGSSGNGSTGRGNTRQNAARAASQASGKKRAGNASPKAFNVANMTDEEIMNADINVLFPEE